MKHPRRSQLLSPAGAQSMLILLAEGWNQLTTLALSPRAVCAGSAGASWGGSHSLGQLCPGGQSLLPPAYPTARWDPCPGAGTGDSWSTTHAFSQPISRVSYSLCLMPGSPISTPRRECPAAHLPSGSCSSGKLGWRKCHFTWSGSPGVRDLCVSVE